MVFLVPTTANLAMAFCVMVMVGCAPIGRHHNDTVSINMSAGWQKADELNQQGIGHFHAGKCDLAESEFRQAVNANEGHGGAHNNLGLVFYNRRNLVKAAHQFGKAVEYTPGNPSPINNFGMTLEAGGRVSEAIELYRRAHQMAPTNPLFLGNLVRAKVRMGECDELVIQQLRDLAFCETRPEWIDWADEQLAIHLNPALDRGPNLKNPLDADRKSKNSVSADDSSVLIAPNDVSDFQPQDADANSPPYEPPMSGDSIIDGYPSSSIGDLQLSPATSMPHDVHVEPAREMLPPPTAPRMIQLQSGSTPITDNANELIDVDVDPLDKR